MVVGVSCGGGLVRGWACLSCSGRPPDGEPAHPGHGCPQRIPTVIRPQQTSFGNLSRGWRSRMPAPVMPTSSRATAAVSANSWLLSRPRQPWTPTGSQGQLRRCCSGRVGSRTARRRRAGGVRPGRSPGAGGSRAAVSRRGGAGIRGSGLGRSPFYFGRAATGFTPLKPRSVLRPAEALLPNSPSCGNQPANISLTRARRVPTRTPTRQPDRAGRSGAREAIRAPLRPGPLDKPPTYQSWGGWFYQSRSAEVHRSRCASM